MQSSYSSGKTALGEEEFLEAFREQLEMEINETPGRQAGVAKRYGVTQAEVSYLARGLRKPSGKLMRALGWKRVVMYRQGG